MKAEEYIAIKPSVYIFGSENQAMIIVNQNQIWELKSRPTESKKYYVLTRENIAMEITEDDFKTKFKRF